MSKETIKKFLKPDWRKVIIAFLFYLGISLSYLKILPFSFCIIPYFVLVAIPVLLTGGVFATPSTSLLRFGFLFPLCLISQSLCVINFVIFYYLVSCTLIYFYDKSKDKK
ncbi:MAG: hypothetical protein WBC21_00040 [Minisyncoccales bacterium]